jgi:uncharacterized protein involved in exopolysaccharide biosynthesis
VTEARDEGAFTEDVAKVGLVLGFIVRAARRRRRLAVVVFIATILASVGALSLMDRVYLVKTRILTNKNYIIPNLVTPQRPIPRAADAPTRGVTELMKSRESLGAIVDDADLVATWTENRSGFGRLKDSARSAILGEMSDEDMRSALVELIDSNLQVYTAGDVVVTRVEWHHPETTMRIAQAAQQRFLETRRDSDLGEVRETLSILDDKVKEAQGRLDAAKADVERRMKEGSGGGAEIPMKTVTVKRSGPAPDPNLVAQLQVTKRDLGELQGQIGTLEKGHRRRLDDAQRALTRLRESLGPAHPDIQQAVRLVEERSRPPSQLNALRQREAELLGIMASIEDQMGTYGNPVTQTIRVPDEEALDQRRRMDPAMETALKALEERIRRHNQALYQLEIAKTELITAQAAFEYRYVVTLPPLMPKRHVKPKIPVILGGGVFAALFLALFFAVLADLRSRRVVEPWQVEAVTDVPVLGIVKVPNDESPERRRASGKG